MQEAVNIDLDSTDVQCGVKRRVEIMERMNHEKSCVTNKC